MNPYPKVQDIPTATYLIVLENTEHFLANRMDDNFGNYVKCVGFFTNLTIEKIKGQYIDLLKEATAEKYVEVSIPWNKIKYIQSLSYRYKGK